MRPTLMRRKSTIVYHTALKVIPTSPPIGAVTAAIYFHLAGKMPKNAQVTQTLSSAQSFTLTFANLR
jgi:hypothetical protein